MKGECDHFSGLPISHTTREQVRRERQKKEVSHHMNAKVKTTEVRPMTHPAPIHATLDDWIAREAIPFSVDAPETLNAAADKTIASLGDAVELLGFGEALHSGEDILILRNRLFERLVAAHGYSAIAIESSFPMAQIVNEYVAGRGPASYEAVQDAGFGQGFGRLEANRELVEWMRRYNADPSHRVKLRFYGFDIPTGTITGPASPSQVLEFVLDYLTSIDSASGQEHRQRIQSLLGEDSEWENTAALADPTKSVGLSPAATSLRIETEDLITELRTRGPELVARSDASQYSEALQYASVARQLLNFHAAIARKSGAADLLGIRDASMADNLAFIVGRERGRGKVLAFAHNRHVQRGKARWVAGMDVYTWWPAGSHLDQLFGPRYAVIGTGLGVSDANGIAQPEAGSLEARLTALRSSVVFIPTHKGQGLSASEIAALPTRSGSMKNPTYFALSSESFTDFDCLAVFDSTGYARGGWPLEGVSASPEQ
jgi:erythromycin esterase-like protein